MRRISKTFLKSDLDCRAACLIVDLRMPRMSGLELQAKLKEEESNVPRSPGFRWRHRARRRDLYRVELSRRSRTSGGVGRYLDSSCARSAQCYHHLTLIDTDLFVTLIY
jgi:hypothetical protein